MPDSRDEAMRAIVRSAAVLASVAAIALGLWVLGSTLDVLLLCFAGVLLGLFLHGAGTWLARRTGLSRPVAVGAFCVLLIGAAGVMAWLAAPSVARQLDELTTTLPRALDNAAEPLKSFSWVDAVMKRARDADDVLARRETWSQAGGAVSTALGGFGSLFIFLFVGLFTAFDPDLYRRGFLRLIPSRRRPRVGEILSLIADTLQMWMVGKLASMALVGIATWVGLALLGIPLAMVLSLIAAILTFIPNLGPILSAMPAILLALLQGPTTALWVAGLYVGIQTVESYILTPIMQKKLVSLPPAVTIMAQVLMGTLAGGLGVVVATPLTAAALVLINEVYVKDLLAGDGPLTQ
jgi:predicted PurR-regulated permease PerM